MRERECVTLNQKPLDVENDEAHHPTNLHYFKYVKLIKINKDSIPNFLSGKKQSFELT